jgi:hypothetical protein
MTALDRLSTLLAAAADRVGTEKLRGIGQALIPAMPQVVEALQEIICDPGSSPAVRLEAIQLLMSMWSRCITADLRFAKSEGKRAGHRARTAEAATARVQARADELAAKVRIAREQKHIQKQLRKLRKET